MKSLYFVRFMKQRAACPEGTLGMDDELIELIKHHLGRLAKKESIQGLIMPSRTWQARDRIAQLLGEYMHAPVWDSLLEWNQIPPKRQGSY